MAMAWLLPRLSPGVEVLTQCGTSIRHRATTGSRFRSNRLIREAEIAATHPGEPGPDPVALADADILHVAPFIEQMGPTTAGGRKEFWWEREWRHVTSATCSFPSQMWSLYSRQAVNMTPFAHPWGGVTLTLHSSMLHGDLSA